MRRILFLVVTVMFKSGVDAVETQIDIIKEASCRGKEEVRDGVEVTLDYDGYLKNEEGKAGKKYTSTYSLSDPFSFTMGKKEVILGLEQGLLEFCAGSELILHIPSSLAYGQKGAGDTIPPGADLIFEVVLVDVKVLETEHEKNIRLEAKAREDELEKRRIAAIKVQEDYAKQLAEEEKRREDELESRKVAEAKANEAYEKQLAGELKRREAQQELVNQQLKQVEEQQKLVDEELKRREEQQEQVRQELKRREEHQKLIDEELERRKVQQELVQLELKAREEEAERRRIESIAREVQTEQVGDELVEREKENERRIIDQNARQHEQERRDQEDQGRLGGEKLSDEEKINQARIFFEKRRNRIKNDLN